MVRRPVAAHRPIRGVTLLLALSCAASAGALSLPDDSTSQGRALLDRLRQGWESRQSLTARFEQTQQFAGFDEPLLSQGRLRILRPFYFDVLFDPPHRQRQVCDGAYVWTYMEEQRQVFKAPLAPEATRSADLLEWALAGATANLAQPDPTMGPGGIRLELTPGSQLPLQELRVWVRGGKGELLGYEAVDTEGNRTRMRVLEIRSARGLKPEDFRFVPPTGVEVIDLGAKP